MYRVEVAAPARRAQRRFPAADRRRIAQAIRGLADQSRPPGTIKITGSIYRARVGAYRVIYSITDREQLVIVVKIARRSQDTYDDVEKL